MSQDRLAPPPKPPFGFGIKLDGEAQTITVPSGFRRKTFDLQALRVTAEEGGERMTLTRMATMGFFAIGAKKQTHHLCLMFIDTRTGEVAVVSRKGGAGRALFRWALKFEAWLSVNGGAA
ncbi:hypothetical protein [Streptacidiphilus sp. MAP5-3]|uniref:hypothetical protein n=1 Tax=unclassified Streptacidiphilus TaxID=2643834 RepID=UPI0035148D23